MNNENNTSHQLENLKNDLLSEDWEKAKLAINRLAQSGLSEITDYLISLLKTQNPSIRNKAALTLQQIKDDKAVEPLLSAIFYKENHNYNGTLVFALESLDCSKYLTDIFKILFYESYEAKLSAYAILSDQIFEFTRDEIREVQKMWANCKLNPKSCPGFEDKKTREMIEDALEGYIGYLDDDTDNI